jgi:hypothetical protein
MCWCLSFASSRSCNATPYDACLNLWYPCLYQCQASAVFSMQLLLSSMANRCCIHQLNSVIIILVLFPSIVNFLCPFLEAWNWCLFRFRWPLLWYRSVEAVSLHSLFVNCDRPCACTDHPKWHDLIIFETRKGMNLILIVQWRTFWIGWSYWYTEY